MNRGKIMFTSLMLAAILIFTGCSAAQTAPEPTTQAVTDRNEEVTYAVFPKDVITVEGTAATYDDGRISFQWDTGEWYLSADANGFPSSIKNDVAFEELNLEVNKGMYTIGYSRPLERCIVIKVTEFSATSLSE